MSSQNYWFEILLKDADLALSYHDQTYIICVSASLPKKLNKSTPGYSISVALNSQGFKGEPPLLLCRPFCHYSLQEGRDSRHPRSHWRQGGIGHAPFSPLTQRSERWQLSQAGRQFCPL